MASELKVNTISEKTSANGVSIDSVKLKDGGIVISDAANIGSASDTDALAISSGGVVTFSQKPVSNSGIAIDNITIDGTEIDLSSGDLTVDVAGDITLDADGGNVQIAVTLLSFKVTLSIETPLADVFSDIVSTFISLASEWPVYPKSTDSSLASSVLSFTLSFTCISCSS